MHLFDANDKLKKYTTVVEIIDDYFVTRLELFQVRKNYLIAALTKELLLLSNKVRYIKELLEGTIDLRKKKKEEVILLLKGKEYDMMDDDEEYKYLVKMPMDSVTEENIKKLEKDHSDKILELAFVESQSPQAMWLTELTALEKEYLVYKEERQRLSLGLASVNKKKTVKKVPKLVFSEEK
jgi:DNA topoisomerase-2